MSLPEPPSLGTSTLSFVRLPGEITQFLLAKPLLRRAPRGDGHAVITIPGFGGADGSMAMMRRWLKRWGYDARRWELGRNLPNKLRDLNGLEGAEKFREEMIDKLCARVETVYEETGRKVSLIGWSLGGIYANAVASRMPDKVRQVITLGTPFGDPRGTIIYGMMKRMAGRQVSREQDDMSSWNERNNDVVDHGVATTVIYSRADGIVSPSIARIHDQAGTDNVAVRASHIGFTFNPRTYWLIADRLSQSDGVEKPVPRPVRRLLRYL